MSGIKLVQPTQEEVIAHAREYALFTQLDINKNGSVTAEDLTRYSKEFGSGAPAPSTGEIKFADLVKLLSKPGEKQQDTHNAVGYAARDESGHLSPFHFTRRQLTDEDVRIQVTYCGVCHSDYHQIKNEWKGSNYPMVPGHEIVGIITEVGKGVKDYKVGDRAGIGCLVDSCRSCHPCRNHEENYCEKGMVQTYNGVHPDGTATQGGYSTHIVCAEKYIIRLPTNLPMDAAAPLLCAGITTWSPLQYYGINKEGMSLGVIGLGGLGHMAVKFGKALGMKVTVFSTSPNKRDEALKRLGADQFVVSKDENDMKSVEQSLDGIIDTVSAPHPLMPFLSTLKTDGKLVMVGASPEPLQLPAFGLINRRLTVAGSMIGGIKETQEMIDFCGKHNVTCDIEKIPIQKINEAMERLHKSDVKYRFVIDVQGSLVLTK